MGYARGWLSFGRRIAGLEDGAFAPAQRFRRCFGIARESRARFHFRLDRLARDRRRQTSSRGDAGFGWRICDGDALCYAPANDLLDRTVHLDRCCLGYLGRMAPAASQLVQLVQSNSFNQLAYNQRTHSSSQMGAWSGSRFK